MRDGVVLAAAMFAQKVGLTIGGATSGGMLGVFGFIPNADQGETAMLGFRFMFSLLPGLMGFSMGSSLFCPLSQSQTEAMQAELIERGLQSSAGSV